MLYVAAKPPTFFSAFRELSHKANTGLRLFDCKALKGITATAWPAAKAAEKPTHVVKDGDCAVCEVATEGQCNTKGSWAPTPVNLTE